MIFKLILFSFYLLSTSISPGKNAKGSQRITIKMGKKSKWLGTSGGEKQDRAMTGHLTTLYPTEENNRGQHFSEPKLATQSGPGSPILSWIKQESCQQNQVSPPPPSRGIDLEPC